MYQLRLSVLDGLAIEHDGRAVTGLTSLKARALLAYLALTGRPHSRQALAGLLWTDVPEDAARASLRTALYQVRRELRNHVSAEQVTLSLDRESPHWIDAHVFEEACRKLQTGVPADETARRRLRKAVNLYGDGFLAGIPETDAALFEDWVCQQREYYRGLAIDALETLATDALKRRDLHAGIELGNSVLELDPLREEAHRLLIRIYAESGNEVAALRQYDECTRVLQEELGVPPADETIELASALKEARRRGKTVALGRKAPDRREHRDTSKSDAPPSEKSTHPTLTKQLAIRDRPIVSSSLIGREREYRVLESALQSVQEGVGQVVLVYGEAGVGKSRLVAELRRQAAQNRWVILAGHCFEQDMLLPYGPLLDALRTFLAYDSAGTRAESPPLAERLGVLAVELVKLLPELALTIPDLEPTPELAPEAERRRLFEALFQFLVRLSQEASVHPLLLIMEDIHWSDETSLDFLRLLARRAPSLPLLVVATYRREEQSPILRQLRTELGRARLARDVELRPLSLDDTDALLRSLLAIEKPMPSGLLKSVYGLTEGNPFFTEEVIQSLTSSGNISLVEGNWDAKALQNLQLPRTLHDTV